MVIGGGGGGRLREQLFGRRCRWVVGFAFFTAVKGELHGCEQVRPWRWWW